ncbi:putative ATP synthase, F0 complex, subunit B/MI25 [Helianthus debilis subsp. tardiflorus]
MARSAPKCEKTVQALLCRNLNVKSATLPNATSSRRIRLHDDLVTGFHFSVSERFVPGSTLKDFHLSLFYSPFITLTNPSPTLISSLQYITVYGNLPTFQQTYNKQQGPFKVLFLHYLDVCNLPLIWSS